MKLLHIASFLLLSIAGNVKAQSSWIQKASMLSTRYIASSFTIDSFAYVGTGYNSGLTPLSDWWKYDPSTDSWTQVADSPIGVTSSSTFAINGKGYLALGLSSNWKFLSSLFMYDPSLNIWLQKASLPGTGRFGAASFSIGNFGYVACGNFGSASGPFTNEVWAYNVVSDSWTKKSSLPGAARYACRGVSLNGYGYMFSGTDGTGNLPSHFLSEIWEYKPQSDSWVQKSVPPTIGRSYPSVFILDNKVVVGCGTHSTGYRRDFYSFDPTTNQWNIIPSLPLGQERWAAVSFTLSNRAYIAAGNKSSNNPIVLDGDLWMLGGDPTYINDLTDFHINIYPNPSSEKLFIEWDGLSDQDLSVEMLSSNGTKVYSMELSGKKQAISTESFSSGHYIISVLYKKKNVVKSVPVLIQNNWQ
jgi:N-acetylneuraminic acid mutarotase